MQDLTGLTLGQYHLLEKLGEGGMAVVYKAYDTHLEQDVAVKVIRTDHLGPAVLDRALKRFEREAKSVAKLNHSNIVSVIDYGEQEGSPYLVMPYLPGGTLKQYLKINGKLSWQKSIQLLLPIAEALGYAHQHNLVHRDVKPANILLTANGEPMLTDFGVAKVLDEEVTQDLTGTAATVGTPEYMAPEQIMSKTVDHRADIYALGVVFFEMVTGRRPFEADTPMAVLVKHASAPLPRPGELIPDLPYGVEKVLIKTLQKKPEDRYQNMSEFATALRALLSTGTVTTPPPIQIEEGNVDPQQPVKRLSGLKLIMFGVTGVVLITAIIVGLTSDFLSRRLTQKTDTDPGKLIETATIILPTLTQLPTTFTVITATYTTIPTLIPTNLAVAGTTQTSEIDGMTMVYVPAGDFLMGSPNEIGENNEHPQHSVYLDAYWIDETEVTNAMYEKCVYKGACTAPSRTSSGTRSYYYGNPDYDDYPVVYVDWKQAQAYCQWAGRQLPTEAQWEKAARGTDGAMYPWGDDPPDRSMANYNGSDTTRVGSYPVGASPYGALDMVGNVWEWVNDWYDANYYSENIINNPTGPISGTSTILRGGSWFVNAYYIRTAYREENPLTYTNSNNGFRCSLVANVTP